MNVTFRFFDKESWSIYATIRSAVLLLVLYLGLQKMNVQILIFGSLLGMLDGDLSSKIVFTTFMCLIVWNFQGCKDNAFIYKTLITIVGVYLIHFIPQNNVIQRWIESNYIGRNLFRLLIICWFVIIGYKMDIKWI